MKAWDKALQTIGDIRVMLPKLAFQPVPPMPDPAMAQQAQMAPPQDPAMMQQVQMAPPQDPAMMQQGGQGMPLPPQDPAVQQPPQGAVPQEIVGLLEDMTYKLQEFQMRLDRTEQELAQEKELRAARAQTASQVMPPEGIV